MFFTQSRNFPHFTEPERSLPSSQNPASCLYPEPYQFGPRSFSSDVLTNQIKTIILWYFCDLRSPDTHLCYQSQAMST